MQFLYEQNGGNITELGKELEKRSKFYKKLSEKILELLQTGIHIYEMVNLDPNTGEEVNTRFLTKAGARYLCNLFDLHSEITTSHRDMPSGDVAFLAECVIKDSDGKELARGEAEQSLFIYRNNNTAKKMARKSALVDAALTLFGLDDYLAQDEDYKRKLDATSINPNLNSTPSLITTDFLLNLAKRKGIEKSKVMLRYGVNDIEEMTNEQMQDAVQQLNSLSDVAAPAAATPSVTGAHQEGEASEKVMKH